MLVATRSISTHDIYDCIEWPVILLLGALIPIGEAMRATGGSELIAEALVMAADGAPVWVVLTLLLVASMWLSDLIHNTPTAWNL